MNIHEAIQFAKSGESTGGQRTQEAFAAMIAHIEKLATAAASHDGARQVLHDYLQPEDDLVMACHRVVEDAAKARAMIAPLTLESLGAMLKPY